MPEGFIQGILDRIEEMTAFLNPLVNSYRRFGEDEAPKYRAWSHENRCADRLAFRRARGKMRGWSCVRRIRPLPTRILAFALLICARVEGVAKKRTHCQKPTNLNLRKADEKTLAAYAETAGFVGTGAGFGEKRRSGEPGAAAGICGKICREKGAGMPRRAKRRVTPFRCEKELYFEGV